MCFGWVGNCHLDSAMQGEVMDWEEDADISTNRHLCMSSVHPTVVVDVRRHSRIPGERSNSHSIGHCAKIFLFQDSRRQKTPQLESQHRRTFTDGLFHILLC